jgi:type II secretory pathway pseudopilin PulG
VISFELASSDGVYCSVGYGYGSQSIEVAMTAMHSKSRARGFSFVDVMIAVVIVGVAIAALAQAFAAGTSANSAATRTTIAINLARNVHEYAMNLRHSNANGTVGLMPLTETQDKFDDIADLNNWNSTQVVNSAGETIPGYAGWQQCCRVYGVSPTNISVNGAITASGIKRLVVQVKYKNQLIHTESWLLAPTFR